MPSVTFPLPPDDLRVNSRVASHWATLQRSKHGYVAQCWPAAKAAPVAESYPVALTITAYLGPRQRCDTVDLGTWAKVAIDCLVSAGVFADDDSSHINPVTLSVVGTDRHHPRLEVTW